MVVFTVIFGKVAKLPADGNTPYGLILGGQSPLNLQTLGMSIVVTSFFLWLGIRKFRKMERSFADLI